MPSVVIAFSGKRKSGKDYCASVLAKKLKERGLPVDVCGVSHSLKKEYAQIKGLDFEELLSDGPYKEEYRKDMIVWGEKIRNEDPSYFCRAACEQSSSTDVLVVPDCRRPSDYVFFESSFPTISVRVRASEETRRTRGWVFTAGIDDAESECALDHRSDFDFVIDNNSNPQVETTLDDLCDAIVRKLSS